MIWLLSLDDPLHFVSTYIVALNSWAGRFLTHVWTTSKHVSIAPTPPFVIETRYVEIILPGCWLKSMVIGVSNLINRWKNSHPQAHYWREKIGCVYFNPFAEDVFMSQGHILWPADSTPRCSSLNICSNTEMCSFRYIYICLLDFNLTNNMEKVFKISHFCEFRECKLWRKQTIADNGITVFQKAKWY